MNKIDPRELRRLDVEKAPLNDNYEENEINFDFSRFFKLSFRHKKIILISFVFFYPLSLFLYVNKSVIYEKVGLFTVNSASNNSFFRYLDQSVGFESGRGRDEVEAYASKALANLGSDDFLNFCYREALKDPEIAKIFGLRLQDKSSSELNHNSKEKLNLFFKTKIQIVPLPPPKIRETARNAGFMLIAKDYDLKFLEYAPEIIEKLIKSYLVSVDVMTSESAKELVKQKVEELQKKINENNERKIKLSQEIPLVDKSTLYNLQAQLQATQITISGNKALEEQFKDSLANVEKKIGSIADEGSSQGDTVDLNRELTSLSNQKTQLEEQGLEKGSFLYERITSSLSKTLKDIENSQKNNELLEKKNEAEFNLAKLSELNKYLDEINVFVSNKINNNNLAYDLQNSLSINFPENNNQKTTAQVPSSPVSSEIVDELMSQLKSLKKAIEGNNYYESQLGTKLVDLEKKILSLKPSRFEDKEVSGYLQDITNMAYLKNQLRLQGVDEDSVITKRISENLKKATKELKDKKNISLKDLNLGDVYSPKIDEATIYSQRSTLEKLKGENNFYQAKITDLNKAIDELGFLLNDKALKEVQLSEIENIIKADRLSLDSLNSSILKMDLNDVKAAKRFDVVFKPIEEKSTLPLEIRTFGLVSVFLCFFIGMVIAYFKELLSPSLNTAEDFEIFGYSVLGGVPSSKNSLFQENLSLEGITNNSYLRLGINIENIMTASSGKIFLLTSSDVSLKSAIVSVNLGSFYGSTGKKTLIIETDLVNNSISKITGAPLNGGVSDLYLHKENINLVPFRVSEGLDVISGDPLSLPSVYRLASKGFKAFLDQISTQYDYIFLHVRPCFDSPEAADLSRYADLSIVCCDTANISKNTLEKLDKEISSFLSNKTGLILEESKDIENKPKLNAESEKIAV